MNDAKTVVESFIHALTSQGPEAALAFLDPAVVVHEVTRLPYAGTYHGHDGFRMLVGKLMSFWESIESEQQTVADGEFAVVIGKIRGRVRTSGEQLEVPVLERYHVKGGRIVELWPFYIDTHLEGVFSRR